MAKGPGTVQVRETSFYNEENEASIMQQAYQSAGFRKVVNTQLKNGFGRRKKRIAEQYVHQAIDTIKHYIRSGIGVAGAGGDSGTITGIGLKASGAAYTYSFHDLAPSTIKRKAKYNRAGRGKFWKDRGYKWSGTGDTLSQAIESFKYPTITHETQLVGLELRKGPDRIDFELIIRLEKMGDPFDDLVRRPMITGDGPEGGTVGNDDPLSVLSHLEMGFHHYKAGYIEGRPWISGFSAEIGNVMFDDLNTNV